MTDEGIEQLKRWLKWYAALAMVPFCFGLLAVWLPFVMSLLMLVGLSAVYLIAIAVTVRWSIAAWRTMPLGDPPLRRVGGILIPPLMLAPAILAFFPLGQAGGRVGHVAQIAIYHERFEEIIAKEKAPHPPMVEASSRECPTGPIPDHRCVLLSFQRGCSITGPH